MRVEGGAAALPVTVVLPAYQAGSYLEPAVRSVLAQVPPPAEVIVVDDGSTDGSAESLGALDLGVIVIRQPNGGEGHARNTGLQRATHDYVALLDADDLWLPGHLAALWPHRQGQSFVSSTAVGSASGRLHGNPTRRVRRLNSAGDVIWPENAVVPSAVLMRRDVALSAGGFSRRKRGADLEMWLRMVRELPGLSLPQVTCIYREHALQVSADGALMRSALQELLDHHRVNTDLTDAVIAKIDARLAWDEARALQTAGRWRDGAALSGRIFGGVQRSAGIAQMLLWRAQGRRRQRASAGLLSGMDQGPGRLGDETGQAGC